MEELHYRQANEFFVRAYRKELDVEPSHIYSREEQINRYAAQLAFWSCYHKISTMTSDPVEVAKGSIAAKMRMRIVRKLKEMKKMQVMDIDLPVYKKMKEILHGM